MAKKIGRRDSDKRRNENVRNSAGGGGSASKFLLGLRVSAVGFFSVNLFVLLFLVEEPLTELAAFRAGSSAIVASLAAFAGKRPINVDTRSGEQQVHVTDEAAGSSEADNNNRRAAAKPHVTFPFYLDCPGPSSFPVGKYNLAILYSVDMVNNWEEIVEDQLHTLIKCGLWGERTTSFGIVMHNSSNTASGDSTTSINAIDNGSRNRLGGIVAEFGLYSKSKAMPKIITLSSGFVIRKFVSDSCHATSNRTVSDASSVPPMYLVHLTNLGASNYDPKWRRHVEKEEPFYTRLIYYRKFVERFTIEQPASCLKGLVVDGHGSCGVDVQKNSKNGAFRYGGNFWFASCAHLQGLPQPLIRDGQGLSEYWIGSNAGKHSHIGVANSKIKSVDAEMPIMYPEQYNSNATRFRLACRNDEYRLPVGNYKLAIVNHVGLMGNWVDILTDQLETVAVCGLGQRVSEWIVTHSGDNVTDLLDILDSYSDRIKAAPTLIESLQSPWEGEAMNSTRQMCIRHKAEYDEPTFVFYFQSKGVSKYRASWKRELKYRSYGQILYWRKFMEYYTIEHPSACINRLYLDGAMTCGAKLRYVRGTRHVGRYHYSGNLWAASCDFVATLPPCTETDYYAAEFYLGEGMPLVPAPRELLNTTKFVDLHESKVETWRNYPSYTHLILPEEYVDPELLDDTYTSFLHR